jgi:3-dehydroquinate dehydratase-2
MVDKNSILVINGPNLNKLGSRKKSVYGTFSLKEIETSLVKLSNESDINLIFFQSNSESEIINTIHSSDDKSVKGIIINAGAFTHTSVAIRDALLVFKHIPFIEIHISNIFGREKFRQFSYLSDIADAVISGMGIHGYHFSFKYLIEKINGPT